MCGLGTSSNSPTGRSKKHLHILSSHLNIPGEKPVGKSLWIKANSQSQSALREYIYYFLPPWRNAAIIRLEASMELDCSLRFFRRCDNRTVSIHHCRCVGVDLRRNFWELLKRWRSVGKTEDLPRRYSTLIAVLSSSRVSTKVTLSGELLKILRSSHIPWCIRWSLLISCRAHLEPVRREDRKS